MRTLNVREAKTHLSKVLAQMQLDGEPVVLCRRGAPIAELRLLPRKEKKLRPIGLDDGKFTVPPEFFEPLDDEELALWEGEGP